ncbi:MAG: glutathione peroxidase [Dichotomicrobium sp.]
MKRQLAAALALALIGAMTATPAATLAADRQAGSAHDFTFTSIDGSRMPLSRFAGKVLLVVNTASMCGYTPQYQGLQSLWQTYRDRGLVVIGAPSNDFGGQEPKSEGEIKEFCQGAFGVNFPLTEKVHVKGPEAHPFYTWAREVGGEKNAPGWNFHKYLISVDGKLVGAFSTRTKPEAEEVTEAIEEQLAAVRTN